MMDEDLREAYDYDDIDAVFLIATDKLKRAREAEKRLEEKIKDYQNEKQRITNGEIK